MTAAPETPALAPPRFAEGRKPLTKVFELDYALEYAGRIIETITIRKVTAGEVDAYLNASREDPDHAEAPFYSEGRVVIDALESSDASRLMETTASFLPALFPPTAASSAQTASGTSSDSSLDISDKTSGA